MSSLTLRLLHYYRTIWWGVLLLSILPALMLIGYYYAGQLGANPLQTLQHVTGRWALIFLLVAMAISPLRQILTSFCIYIHVRFGKRLEDWNWIIRLRRMLGLCCFFYATLHTLVYLLFDLALQWSWALDDIREKPYIILGLAAFVMLIPLAATSHNRVLKLMGVTQWKRLHKSLYLILIIVLLHFWWQTKVGVYIPWPYTAAAVFLLGYRLLNWLGIIRRRQRDDGMETSPRA